MLRERHPCSLFAFPDTSLEPEHFPSAQALAYHYLFDMPQLIALHDRAARILWAESTTPVLDADKLKGRRFSDYAETDQHRDVLQTKLSRCIVYHEPASLVTHLSVSGQRVILRLRTHCLSLRDVAAVTTATVVPTSILSLSDREKECLALLAKGRTAKQIGRQLRISYSTVETHYSRAKGKLSIKTHDALLAFALDYLRE